MSFDQKRREFITLLGGAAVAWPLAARAQHQLPVIGILSSRSRATDALLLSVIRQALNDSKKVLDPFLAPATAQDKCAEVLFTKLEYGRAVDLDHSIA